MANTIPQRQNEPQSLRRRVAARYFYGRAKQFGTLQFVLATLIPGAAIIVQRVAPTLEAWVALVGIVTAIAGEVVFEGLKRSYRDNAARIQELFDCDVLEIPWSALIAGDMPDPEVVFDAAITDTDTAALRDWYSPSVGHLDIALARLICQRTNCFWDAKQRRQYRNVLAAAAVLLTVVFCVVATAADLTSRDLVVKIIAPLLPLILWTAREYKEQSDSAARLDRLRTFTLGLWADALHNAMSTEQITAEARRLQDAIY